jgi:hypothetical protein
MENHVLLRDNVLNRTDSVSAIDALFAVTKFPTRFSVVFVAQGGAAQPGAVVQGGNVLAHSVARPDSVGFR